MRGTFAERILAKASNKRFVQPGEIVEVAVDQVMIHDNNAALVIKAFNEIVDATIWDPGKIAFFIDHHSPSTSQKSTEHHKLMRNFAKRHNISSFFDCGKGISHIVMLEEQLAIRGEIVVGTDSHTIGEGAGGAFAVGIGATEMAAVISNGKIWFRVPETIKIILEGTPSQEIDTRDIMSAVMRKIGPEGANYCSVEFHGAAARAMSLDARIMCCVMCAEMGAKNAVFQEEDSDIKYSAIEIFDVSTIEPSVAVPSLPTNIRPLREIEEQKIAIDQAVIGSCAGGLLSDMKIAAEILNGKKIARGVRLLVIPASRNIYNAALTLGYMKILHDAGAIISSPACGACGAHDLGVLSDQEVCVANTPRNMKGRMGTGGVIYLAGTAIVAASAIKGYITGKGRGWH